jgi:selT/selW/selH-like putative selenoprotein
VSLANELLAGWAPVLHGVALRTGTKGRFEVSLDGELIFSKASAGRHAEQGEVRSEVERRIGKPLDWRQK